MLTVTLALLAQAPAQDVLMPMLQRGPMATVEQTKDGKFQQATAVVLVNAPVEKVWGVVVDQDKFKDFMPKILMSQVSNASPKGFDVHMMIEVPGPDTDYVIHFDRDDAKHVLKGSWKKGDLKDSKWEWRVEPTADGKSLVFNGGTVKNFSSILTSIEDDQQTMTVGVNVTSVLAATKSIKARIESPPAAADAGTK
jgi:ribosome-associated toxin RatA of RatAB toxin-antitoxin module